MRSNLYSLLFVLFGIFPLESARADFFVEIDTSNSYVAGDQNVLLSVYAYSDIGGSDRWLNGMRLGFDLDPLGAGVRTDFSGFRVIAASDFNLTSFQDQVSTFDNFDFGVSLSAKTSDTIDLATYDSSANRLKLFDLEFDISMFTPGGTYDFSFVDDATFTVNSNTFAWNSLTGKNGVSTSLGFSSVGGSFTVTAVPEPTSFTLLGIGMAGFIGARLARKKRLRDHPSSNASTIV